ncbi:S49 family peptidase [Spiribacter insolitus]|uniref:S49 family peptidase n=1 Tax=Spiribacter insolitus TaxID=3122417 RepID=A0ABV3T790_9GAMM
MGDEEKWARESLREIALEGIRERRRARRWAIFMRLLFLAVIVTLFFFTLRPSLQMGESAVTGPHTAVVQINGPIMAGRPANADRIIQGLEAAFEAAGARGVLLEINSPGGSPVASSRIYQAIDRLREAHPGKPVHAVAGDMMASGAYYVAAAADQIHVDGASIIGSIGVVSRGFGFSDAIQRLGIERRVYTAGDEKAGMDPFTPPEPGQVERLRGMLDGIHDQFIAAVREGRGDRLTGNPETLFSGRVWTGSQGIEQGLADGFGSPESVAREVIGAPDRVNYMPRRGLLDRALEQIGSAAVAAWVELQSPLNLR